MKKLLLSQIVLIVAAVALCAQGRTNRLYRPCPNTTSAATFEIDREGDLNFSPCSGRTVAFPTTAPLKLVDPNFTQAFGATNYFSIGSSAAIAPLGTWTASQIGFTLNLSNVNTFRAGQYTSINTTGTANGGTIWGHLMQLNAQSHTGTLNGLLGYSVTVDVNRPVLGAIGGNFSAVHSSSGADGTQSVIGVRGIGGGSHLGVAPLPIAVGVEGEFNTALGGGLTTLGIGLRSLVNLQSNGTLTELRGVSIGDWVNAGLMAVPTSYGLYIDSTVDIGAARYSIYSLSTSPAFYTGKQTFDVTNAAGGVTGNQTINKPSFSINFAAGTSSLVVTNSFITANSYVLCTVQTNDATALLKNATPAAGSVTIRLNANATAETRVACLVTN